MRTRDTDEISFLSEGSSISDTTLTFLLTGGGTLRTWSRIGTLQRETELYRRLCASLKKVNLISYGGDNDRVYEDDLGNITLIPSIGTRVRRLDQLALWLRHRKALEGTDIIKTNQIPGAELAIWLKRKLGCRLIVRCGYLWSLNFQRSTQDRRALQRVLKSERRAFEEADIGVVTTAANLEHVVERHDVDPSKLRVIPNYVDVDRFMPKSDPPHKVGINKIVYVGRLVREKNLDLLLEAMRIIKGNGTYPVELTLIGAGRLREPLERRAEEAKLPVSFLGSLPNEQLPQHLQNATAFVLPSKYENHPKSLLEAMACGTACIGTDVEGIRGEIQHDISGYICQENAESIADAIEIVVGDSELQHRLGTSARRHIVENYAVDRILELERRTLQEVLGRASTASP